jgi:hypothetical protein
MTAGILVMAAGLGLAGLGTGGALAANANPQVALASGAGGTTCGHFMRLSKSGQDRLVRRLVRAAPAGTLATIPPSASGNSTAGTPETTSQGDKTATAASTAPLRASDLTAACQAATRATTLRDAYTKFALGGSASSSQ